MTKVNLLYNPFTVKTEILINDDQVTSTSVLYRYRNTPMQDWVESFLPNLVEHCNDDEIEITFYGLQFNYDKLEEQVALFRSENRDIDIGLKHEVSKSQIGRIGELSAIMNEIKSQDLIPDLKTDKVLSKIGRAFSAQMEVIVVSVNDELKSEVIRGLLEKDDVKTATDRGVKIIDVDKEKSFTKLEDERDFDMYTTNIPFVSSKYVTLVLTDTPNSETQDNCYYRFIKKSIASTDKPIILFVLDKKMVNNNEEFLSLISEQYKKQGKQNKERFIFVAENGTYATKYLYSDYAMRNVLVYSIDELDFVQDKIKKYIEEYILVDKVIKTVESFNAEIDGVKINLENSANKNKNIDKIKKEYEKTIQIIENVEDFYINTFNEFLKSRDEIDSIIYSIIKKLENSFDKKTKKIFEKPIKYGVFYCGRERGSLAIDSIEYSGIFQILNQWLTNQYNDFINEVKVNIDAMFPYLTPYEVTENIFVTDFNKRIIDFSYNKCNNKQPLEELNKNNDIKECFSFKKINEIAKKYRSIPEYRIRHDNIFLSSGEKNSDEVKSHMADMLKAFRRSLNDIVKPILQSVFQSSFDVYIKYKASLVDELKKIISQTKEEAKFKFEELKQQAQISVQDQDKLNYADSLLQKLSGVISLEEEVF